MVRVLHQFIHFVRTVGRAEHMDFLAGHLFRTQAGFKQAAGLGTGQVWRQQGVAVIIAECLLGQQHLAAGALGQAAQNFRVAGQGVFIQQVAGVGSFSSSGGMVPPSAAKGGRISRWFINPPARGYGFRCGAGRTCPAHPGTDRG